MRLHLLFFLFLIFGSCEATKKEKVTTLIPKILHDSHVHIMSPQLIASFKESGIHFSKSEEYYSIFDTILQNNLAAHMNLIGMGYVYGNPEFYDDVDAFEKMQEENNYLLKVAQQYPKSVKPYFGIDPLQSNAILELERCHKLSPNSGLKLHFSASQVDLTIPAHLIKVQQIFAQAAKYDFPILLHLDNARYDFDPRRLDVLVDSILEKIPAIHLQIAHLGTSGGFSEKTKQFLDAFIAIKSQNRIPDRHHVYFDISAVALDKDSEEVARLTLRQYKILRSYIDKIGIENISFGSDYPLYTSQQYYRILKDKVGLTTTELEKIMTNNMNIKSE